LVLKHPDPRGVSARPGRGDPADRRPILVRALRDRNAELFRLYAGSNATDELANE